MKNLFILSIAICSLITPKSFAQLRGFYYQAVAIDDKGKEIAGQDINGLAIHNKAIGVRFSIFIG